MLGLGLGVSKTAGLRSFVAKLLSTLKSRATYYENNKDSKQVVQDLDTIDVLDKASILLTPTAYSDARVHSVKTYTGTDIFDINDSDVQSGNWVINTGSNTLTKAASGSSTGYVRLRQPTNPGMEIGGTYLVTITASGVGSGSNSLQFYNQNSVGDYITTDGTYSQLVTVNGSAGVRIRSTNNTQDITISNISIVDVSSDFDFDRASSATRINSSGLVQDMQSITDPELVLNGDFSEIDTTNAVSNPTFDLGSELVTNGTFDTDSDWSLENTWTIENGLANGNGANGSAEELTQANTFTLGKTYKVVYQILNYVNGNVRFQFAGGATLSGTTRSADGTYTEYIVATANHTLLKFKAGSEFYGSIDNVSVKEITDWDEVPAGWSIDSNGATHASGNTGILKQYNVTVADNKTWKVQLKVNNVTSGTVIFESGDQESIGYGEGTHEFYHKNTTGNTLGLKPSSDFVGTIEYVNVFEVDPNDRWTVGDKWSIANGAARLVSNDSDGSGFIQSSIFTIGNTYNITFDATVVSGKAKLEGGGGGTLIEIDETKTYNHTFVAERTDLYFNRITSVSDISLDNVSVKDITFSTDVDLARINYDSNGENGHILLEPTSTNLVTYSEDFSEWDKGGSTTVTTNFAISPDGTQNATRFQTPTGSGTYLTLAASMTIGNDYTLTLYLKNNGGENVDIGVAASSTVGTKTASIEVNLTNEWVRYELNFTADSNSNFVFIDNISNANSVDCLIWGAQLEELSYATSYIPSLTGSTVTRATETLNGSGNSTLINSTEGVLYAEIAALANDGTTRRISLSDGSTSNRVSLELDETSNKIKAFISSGGVSQILEYTASDLTQYNKIAIKYKANDFALWLGGVERDTDVSGSVPIGLNTLEFAQGSGSQKFYGKCKALTVFNEALSDDELELLTGVTNYGSFGELAQADGYTII